MSSRRRRRASWRAVSVALALVLVGSVAVGAAVATNAAGLGDRFESLVRRVALAVDPPPDRPIEEAVLVTPPPAATPTARPVATPAESPDPSVPLVRPSAPPTPVPTPARVPVDRTIVDDAEAVFNSQVTKELCAPAGVQMVLAVLGLADTSDRFQEQLQGRIDEWESWRDSHNGGWGPSAMVLALDAYGAEGYELRAYKARSTALRDAAVAIDRTGSPAILLAWRGAHTWVMTGYRADADPALFPDANVTGAYILDPWFPRVSSIWGPSDPPNTFQDAAEMKRNYLPWKRPEGKYPNRDGLFIAVIPTEPASSR